MKAADLDLAQLLAYPPGGGVLTFGGERAAILDLASMGLLRRELIETLGEAAARGVLTRFGFAHGWRTAESLEHAYPWDDVREWRRAGGRIHTLQGLVVVEGHPDQGRPGRPFAEATWRDSYEAEQHLLQLGRSETPVCWTLSGFASGYLSRSNGLEVYCVETRCVARGDAVCAFVGQTRAEWGSEIESELVFYERDCLDEALKQTRDALRRAKRRLRARRRDLDPEALAALGPGGLVARSEALRRTLDLAQRAAKVDTTVLISGESGVGKERVARLIHESSPRAAGPFLAVNCGAISPQLIESELFGHAKGSFTGAGSDRAGLFEAAQRGTLLLDEVGELPLSTQVKLLRVLQEREVRRVGENQSRKVDVRLLAATNRDLAVEVSERRFREDLLYRLKVVELRIAPLRERGEDVLPSARVLLAELAEQLGLRPKALSPGAAALLVAYGWPGNVRELRNTLERALVVALSDTIQPEDLPEELQAGASAARPGSAPRLAAPRPSQPGATLAEVEREHILATLSAHEGNRARAALALGIGVATLYRRLKQYAQEEG